jgi:hypothetical protein
MHAITLLIAALIAAQQPVTKHVTPKNKQQQTAANATNKTLHAIPTNTPPQQQTSADQTEQNQQASRDRIYKVEVAPQSSDPWFKWYVIFTGVIAALNVGILFLMWLQRAAMLGQINEMQQARQHDRDMAKLEYRARLQFDGMEGGFTQNGALNAKIRIKNGGRTPAKDVHMWYSQEKAVAGNKPMFSYTKEYAILHHVIPPHGSATLTHGVNTFGVTSEQWIKIERDELFVYLHGMITVQGRFQRLPLVDFLFRL